MLIKTQVFLYIRVPYLWISQFKQQGSTYRVLLSQLLIPLKARGNWQLGVTSMLSVVCWVEVCSRVTPCG